MVFVFRTVVQNFSSLLFICILGFTLTDISLSRSLRSDEGRLINLKKKRKMKDHDKRIDDCLLFPKFATEKSLSVTSGSSHRSPDTQYIAANEQYTITKSVNEEKDEFVLKTLPGDEEHRGYASLVIRTDDDPLFGQSTDMQTTYSSYTNDSEKAYTEEIFEGGKQTTIKAANEPLPSNLENATEEIEKKKFTHSQDKLEKIPLQTTALYFPAKEKENFAHTGTALTNTTCTIWLIVPF